MPVIRFFPIRPARQIFVLVLLAMFILTGVLMGEVRGRLQDLSTASTDNLQWNIAQLEVELLRLDGQISQVSTLLARQERAAGAEGGLKVRPPIWPLRCGYCGYGLIFSTVGCAPMKQVRYICRCGMMPKTNKSWQGCAAIWMMGQH